MEGPSRRLFLAGAAATTAAPALVHPAKASVITNPLARQRADAQVFRHSGGDYYMTALVPGLVLRRSLTLVGLTAAKETVLWRHLASGPMSGFIWAAELHRIDGRWITSSPPARAAAARTCFVSAPMRSRAMATTR